MINIFYKKINIGYEKLIIFSNQENVDISYKKINIGYEKENNFLNSNQENVDSERSLRLQKKNYKPTVFLTKQLYCCT